LGFSFFFFKGERHRVVGIGEEATREVMSMFPLIELLFPSNKFVYVKSRQSYGAVEIENTLESRHFISEIG